MAERIWEYDPGSDYHNGPEGTCYVEISLGDSPDAPSRFARIDKGPTAKDDAALIAAAPKLLDMCRRLANWEAVRPDELARVIASASYVA